MCFCKGCERIANPVLIDTDYWILPTLIPRAGHALFWFVQRVFSLSRSGLPDGLLLHCGGRKKTARKMLCTDQENICGGPEFLCP